MEIKHTKTYDVSWKNTFNTNLANWKDVPGAITYAKNCGYPYIAWNGWVYDTYSNLAENDRLVEADKLPT